MRPGSGSGTMKQVLEGSVASRGEPEPVILLKAWWAAAGPALARCARSLDLKDGTLQVVVGDPMWRRPIRELSQTLLDRLHRWPGLHRVRDISVVLESGAAPAALRPSPVPTVSGSESRPPEEILQAAESISDPDLSRRWCAAVGRLLARVSQDTDSAR